jgi:hypothetical protein
MEEFCYCFSSIWDLDVYLTFFNSSIYVWIGSPKVYLNKIDKHIPIVPNTTNRSIFPIFILSKIPKTKGKIEEAMPPAAFDMLTPAPEILVGNS